MIEEQKDNQILGWIAVCLSTTITCFWAFWGIVENFHEGWYYESPWLNLGLMFAQYLSPMLVFMLVTVTAIFWPRFGGILHGIIAFFIILFFQGSSLAARFLIIMPLLGVGTLYWFSRIHNSKLVISLAAGLPILIMIISGIRPIIRVSQRLNDGNLDARIVEGNGVNLSWAPDGPGWPNEGEDWFEARRACDNLTEDGLDLMAEPQYIWRLPTVDEAVRSMACHGKNCQGEWNAGTAEAAYHTKPDKESPLWNIHSQVIYWWTATEIDSEKAYMIVYDGKVWPRSKDFGPANLGFRCVKTP